MMVLFNDGIPISSPKKNYSALINFLPYPIRLFHQSLLISYHAILNKGMIIR